MADRFVRAALIAGVWIAWSTELLGSIGQLLPVPLALAWLLFLIAAGAFMFMRRPPPANLAKPPVFEIVLGGFIAVLLGILLLIAIKSPPNSADAMAYHMPRVFYWAQSASVSFFPTPYLNQSSLQPLAEYFILHTYILTGGDKLANLVQWFGFAGCIIAASLIAGKLGAGRRGKILAALFAATLPNAILQASGAKNDLLMAFWLAAMVYFLLKDEIGWSCWALALAIFTKATAYLFAPGLVLACIAWKPSSARYWKTALVAILLINGPLYFRNFQLSGSPLGHNSAQGDGLYRWMSDEMGLRQTASNALRHLSDQLGGRSAEWNQSVYNAVLKAHSWVGADLNDPNSTFPGARFGPPVNANHEANANNRWHLLFLAAVIAACVWFREKRCLRYAGGLAAALLLFCAYLNWQMFMGRMLTPLFLLSAPLVGVIGERLRPAILQAAACLFLISGARLPVSHNWVRPLIGPKSILNSPREDGYFNDMTQWNNADTYKRTVKLLADSDCNRIGIDINYLQLEYPLEALLHARKGGAIFVHTGVNNSSRRYEQVDAQPPCAIVCMDCLGIAAKETEYETFGPRTQVDRFLLFFK